jgi:hypothetical protein
MVRTFLQLNGTIEIRTIPEGGFSARGEFRPGDSENEHRLERLPAP